jgi:hypothetical protein
MSFSTWFSVRKTFPDAEISLALPKAQSNAYYFRWAKKAELPRYRYRGSNPKLSVLGSNLKHPLLIVDAGTMALRPLPEDILNVNIGISQDKTVWFSNEAFFATTPVYEKNLIGGLSEECKSENVPSFVSISESCGSYSKKTWLSQAKSPPFTYTKKFKSIDDTVNERAVFNLWEQASIPYSLMI